MVVTTRKAAAVGKDKEKEEPRNKKAGNEKAAKGRVKEEEEKPDKEKGGLPPPRLIVP
jgi:hypothetical protein